VTFTINITFVINVEIIMVAAIGILICLVCRTALVGCHGESSSKLGEKYMFSWMSTVNPIDRRPGGSNPPRPTT
jgi:hypothetical protein